jgi:hypothetical protein
MLRADRHFGKLAEAEQLAEGVERTKVVLQNMGEDLCYSILAAQR